jgi:thiol-disulfide isomerase/thioredoxin
MKQALRVSAPSLLTLPLAALLLLSLSACGSAEAKPFEVTYYYMPGCADCDQAKNAVVALEQDFPGQVKVESMDATSPEGAEMAKMLGFKEAALVIRSHRGAVLWKGMDHKIKMDDIREELKKQIAFQEAS